MTFEQRPDGERTELSERWKNTAGNGNSEAWSGSVMGVVEKQQGGQGCQTRVNEGIPYMCVSIRYLFFSF